MRDSIANGQIKINYFYTRPKAHTFSIYSIVLYTHAQRPQKIDMFFHLFFFSVQIMRPLWKYRKLCINSIYSIQKIACVSKNKSSSN